MLLAEEFALLTVDEVSGKKTLTGEYYGPALGVALLVELALMERVSVAPASAGRRERGRVTVTSTKPTDDPELDAVLQVVEQQEGVKIGSLVSDLGGKRRITKGLHERLLGRLVAAGVLAESRSDVLGMRRWPTLDPGPDEEIRRRLHACLVGDDQPTERTAALVSLLQATDVLLKVVRPADSAAKKAIAARAKALSEGDWGGAAVKAAVEEVHAGMA
jgi:hypothetical protein